MSIIIRNLGPTTEQNADDPMGERQYELRINNRVLAYFKHTRKNGLAACLREAANAAEQGYFNNETNTIDYFLKEKN